MPEPTIATDVIPLSEQFDNHDAYRPEPTDALAGRALALHLKDGSTLDVRFDSATELTWNEGTDATRRSSCAPSCTSWSRRAWRSAPACWPSSTSRTRACC